MYALFIETFTSFFNKMYAFFELIFPSIFAHFP